MTSGGCVSGPPRPAERSRLPLDRLVQTTGATMMRLILTAMFAISFWTLNSPAKANVSRCIAYVERGPGIVPVKLSNTRAAGEVRITYVGHSTFRLRTPAGVVIATDYAGFAGEGPVPNIATMNHAHETHYTDFPDPAIKHVLKGWNPKGGPAEHRLTIADVFIRNVPTDIILWETTIEPYGNSIFIFEVADLCIGHLGHLHHKPTPEQLAKIGRLDVVFAPVDGSYTLDLVSMMEVLKALRASLVIPMHYFDGSSLEIFLAGMRKDFKIRTKQDTTMSVSLSTLPDRPTVLVLPGY
jgi:L-ascorbate metabolism protein UlaG (beta-lactamase superfamily)